MRQHKIKIAEGVNIKSSDNGFDAFERIDARLNITSNDGAVSGGIASSKVYVTEQSQFDTFHKNNFNPDPAAPGGANTINVITSLGSPNTYQIEQGGTVLATGNFESSTIKFAGMEINVSPVASGQIDITLEAPKKENVLNTMTQLIEGLTNHNLTQDEFEQVLGDSLVQISNAKNNVSLTQAGLGGRKNTAEKVLQSNTDLDINNKSARSDLVDIDITEAITELTKQETALQASQATFGRLAKLSLFDYL